MVMGKSNRMDAGSKQAMGSSERFLGPNPMARMAKIHAMEESRQKMEQKHRHSSKKRSDKILRLFDWNMQEKFDHLTDDQLEGEDCIDKILKIMDIMINEDGSGEKKKASREALFDIMRASDEIPAQLR